MNVIKFSIIILAISFSVFAKDTFNFNLTAGIGLTYGSDTLNGRDFSWTPTLGFRTYFSKNLKEIKVGDNTDEYEGEFKIKPVEKMIIKDSLFIDSMLKLKFSEESGYGSFLKEEKSYFDLYLGAGYLLHIKNTYYTSFLGGINLYYESNKKSFNEDNQSSDIPMEYKEKEDSFIDYGFYLGFETIFFIPSAELNDLFSFKISFIYNYKIVLDEYNILSLLTVGYNF